MPGHNNGCCGLSPCLVPSVVDVVSLLSIVALGRNNWLIGLLCRVGYRHIHVALVYRSVCDFFVCKEYSVVSRVSGPLKAGFPLLRHP